MHIRSEFRARTLQDPKKAAAKATAAVGDRDRRPGAEGDRDASKDRKDKGEVAGEDRKHRPSGVAGARRDISDGRRSPHLRRSVLRRLIWGAGMDSCFRAFRVWKAPGVLAWIGHEGMRSLQGVHL